MYACTPTHIQTHQTFFYAVKNFIFDKKKARNYHSSEQKSSVTCRSCGAIIACNK